MTWRRFAVILAFLWLGALTGFAYKYRDDLLTVGKTLTTERWQRERLDRELQAFGQTQREQATTLVTLQTKIAANTEICSKPPPDLSDQFAKSETRIAESESKLAASVAKLAASEARLTKVETRAAANARAHQNLQRRIFRK